MNFQDIPAERQGKAAPPDLEERRRGLAGAVAAGYFRTEPEPEEISLAGVRALRFQPEGQSRGTILHLHGGGFRLGCPESVGPFAAALARRCQVTVVCPAYRLAPEHPFPAGIRDGWAALEALTTTGQRPLILSGDSAGGGLAASVAQLATAAGIPPGALLLLSPWLDLRVNAESYRRNGDSDPLFSEEAARTAADLYLQGLSPADPLASPLIGPVEGLPPTFINVSDCEVLEDDARHFHDRLADAGIPVELLIVPGMEHVAVTRNFALPGAEQTFEALVAFIDRQLADRLPDKLS